MTSLLKRFLLPAVLLASLSQASAAEPDLKLYAMDCGRAQFADLGPFADTGEYDGHPGTLMTPCFLIRHPKGDLLWEAGLGDRYAEPAGGTQLPFYRAIVDTAVAAQLGRLGLGFDDVEHFAFSHAHGDHLGNANALAKATWIVNRRELEWIRSVPAPPRTNAKLIATQKQAATVLIDGDHDVFGDGSVRILKAPGHTPGHQVLLLRLPRSGPVLLSGDLYHSHENRAEKRMPVFNVSRSETLASMDRIERIVKNQRARVVIQHSMDDFKALPVFPAYLD
ncbi:N-acyl homoserine lactonase family protein [Lysobacter sp. 1R34A]|uniref:N-acyl homoserine lactonase family protein n=1 Tax=Lysobacter sp. 1R34A TaxID=3445786 RepID=UPI003EEEE2AB